MVSKGNSATTQAYSFDDPTIGNIISNTTQLFYRIQQIDLDGKNSWSSVIAIKIPEQNSVSVYPNPVKKGTLPGIHIANIKNATAELYDVTGKLLLRQRLVNGYNILQMQKKTSGWCVLKVISSDGIIKTFKILIE